MISAISCLVLMSSGPLRADDAPRRPVTWVVGDQTIVGVVIHADNQVMVGWGSSYDLGYDETETETAPTGGSLLVAHHELREWKETPTEPWGWDVEIRKPGKDRWAGSHKFSDGEGERWGSWRLKKHTSKWRGADSTVAGVDLGTTYLIGSSGWSAGYWCGVLTWREARPRAPVGDVAFLDPSVSLQDDSVLALTVGLTVGRGY